MARCRPDNRLPILKKSLLRINGAVFRLRGRGACEQPVRTALIEAYSGRKCPEVLAYDQRWQQHFTNIAEEVMDGIDIKGKTVLDIGCGVGVLTLKLLAAGARPVICIDACSSMVDQCRERVVRNGYGDADCTFIVGQAAELPLPSVSVDAVFSSMTLNLCPEPERIAIEMLRVLRPGGEVSLAIPGAACQSELQDALIRHAPLRSLIGRPPAFWPLTSREAHQLCASAGFGEISVKHAYWQDAFATPDDAFAFTLAVSANLWAAVQSDRSAVAIEAKIRQSFVDRRIVKLTQDMVYVRARKADG